MSNPKGNPATLKKYTPKWKHGYTRTIRVPVALADEILDYAHKLDDNSLTQVNSEVNNGSSAIAIDPQLQGENLIETLTQANETANGRSSAIAINLQDRNLAQTLIQVIEVLESVCEAPNTSKFTKALKTRIQTEAIQRLKALTQVNKNT